MINEVIPYSIKDLKKVHGIMTYLTVRKSGDFRTGDEGVFDGDKCIFMCPSAEMINGLITQLFKRK